MFVLHVLKNSYIFTSRLQGKTQSIKPKVQYIMFKHKFYLLHKTATCLDYRIWPSSGGLKE
jgi:hypothetical protein